MFIHAVHPSSAAPPSLFASNRIAFPPSPPQSPPKQHHHYLSAPKHISSRNLIWEPTWHAVHNMASSDPNEHCVVFLDTHQPVPYVDSALDPLFRKHHSTHAGEMLPPSAARSRYFRQFVELNEKFADQIVERYRSDDDTILIHDYSLLLLPGILRRRLPQATIALVCYARFPVLDSRLSDCRHILESVLAADVVAFQMQRDIDALNASARGSVPFCCLLSPTVHVATPRPIHNPSRSSSSSSGVTTTTTILCHNTDNHPSLFPAIQQAAADTPTRTFIYVASQAPIVSTTATHTIRVINQSTMTAEEYSTVLAAADVALIMGHSSVATLAAQTFLATNPTDVPLVVSPGTPLEQHASLALDAADGDAVSRALRQPLPPRRPQGADARMSATEFVDRLSSGEHRHRTPLLNTGLLTDAYQDSRRRLFLFDYDGTLTPIVPKPDDAKPTAALLHHLQTLCNDPRNTVWVVSGRDQATLASWLGEHVRGLGMSAEHGSFMKQPDGEWVNMLAQHGDALAAWQDTALDVFQRFTDETPGTVVEQKKASITWHYRNALDQQHALAQCEACFEALQRAIDPGHVDILRGKMNLEVRSRLVNKGHVVTRIQQSVNPDFILCAGDDRTDEDMFNALAPAHPTSGALQDASTWCVHIGPQDKETAANWSVPSSEQFVASVVGQLSALHSMNRPAL